MGLRSGGKDDDDGWIMTGNICFDCAAVACLTPFILVQSTVSMWNGKRRPVDTNDAVGDRRQFFISGCSAEDMERIIPEQRCGATVISFLCRCAEQ